MNMREVKIITDSCSDLTTELMERYSIDYALMNTVLVKTKSGLLILDQGGGTRLLWTDAQWPADHHHPGSG